MEYTAVKYIAQKEFWLGGKRIVPGAELDLEPSGARWLLGQGKVRLAKPGPSAKTKRAAKDPVQPEPAAQDKGDNNE